MPDHREITVAGEARSARPAGQARRRSADRPAPGSEWRAALGALVAGTIRACRRNPGGMIGGAVALGTVVVVSMNALGFQVGRHPAPILPKVAVRQGAAAAVAPAKAAEVPAKAPVRIVEAAGAPARDAIGDLIRSDETTASVSPKSQPPAKVQASVMQAQRALTKLGYGPLKADGVMGATTRAAIEKFERDRKLPVKGEASGRTLRALAASSGLPPA
ncbi:peptidoglycan-binding protein [uncultured Methylobacterium sp.]|uniref:peptidoglycan-binding domain-containing protein n=1 Tax=uncultured Methylobacterium sp. TaxID=157278 RepID=UPI0035CBE281